MKLVCDFSGELSKLENIPKLVKFVYFDKQ